MSACIGPRPRGSSFSSGAGLHRVPSPAVSLVFQLAVLAAGVFLVARVGSSDVSRGDGPPQDFSSVLRDLTLNYRENAEHESERHRESERACHSGNASSLPAGKCGLTCQCRDGRWNCCRVRKSYEELSAAEKERLVAAFLRVSRDKQLLPMFRSIAWSHGAFACRVVMRQRNMYPVMMAYHRLMLLAMENLLRRVDCRITLPFWDIGKNYEKPWLEQPPLRDRHLFGGDGTTPDWCVHDGKLAVGQYNVPMFKYGGGELRLPNCLRRHVNDSSAPYPWQLVQTILSVSSEEGVLVVAGVLGGFDVLFHYGIGGSLRDISLPIDPLFSLAHSYMDKLIATYQARGPTYMSAGGYFNSSQRITAFPWFRAADFMDIGRLPGDVCVAYGASMSRDRAVASGYYAALELPRDDHLYLPYKELRDKTVTAAGARSIAAVLGYYKHHFASFKFNATGFHIHDWQAAFAVYALRPQNPEHVALGYCKRFLAADPEFLEHNATVWSR